MRAVLMAGGAGTRLRPLTTNVPKPLLPVAGEPIMGHILRLLARHGTTEAVVTVQYLAGAIRSYFGDGSEYGVRLSFATESVPLGTAGSVKNAEKGLAGEPFLVVSGDALTDIDLTELIAFHRDHEATVTVALARKPNVVEFGNVITTPDGRVERFIEKPTWGQVVSDTVNTGIYVIEPQVLDRIPAGTIVDWAADVFPDLLADGEGIYGYVTDAYWEDIGTIDSYLAVQRDALSGAVGIEVAGFEMAPNIWLGEGAVVDPGATLLSPSLIGANSSVANNCVIGPGTVLGSNVMVSSGSRVSGSVLDTSVFVGVGCEVSGALIGRSTELRGRVHVDQGAVIGDQCVLEDEVVVTTGVHVYPAKRIEAGSIVNDHVVWEAQAHRSLFGPRGVSGVVNLDITAEMVVRLGAAYATMLPKGSIVTLARDHSRAARAMNRALAGSLTAAGLRVRDLRIAPLPLARSDASRSAAGGVYLRTTPGVPANLDVLVLDGSGSDLPVADQQRLERILARRDFRRAFPGDIGDIHTPHRVVDDYATQLARSIDLAGVREAGLKVVIDTGLGAAALVLPRVLSELGISVLTVNNRLDEDVPTSTEDTYQEAITQLAGLVSSSRSDLGVRFDPTGERLSLVDETGRPFDHGRALLVMLDLVAAERRGGVVALPGQFTRVAEGVAAYHGVSIAWGGTDLTSLTRASRSPGLIFGGDGSGGFIIPEVASTVDGIAAFVRLVGMVARAQLTLSAIDARIPQAHMAKAAVPTPWAKRGSVMRGLIEQAGDRVMDLQGGLRVRGDDESWVLAVPDETQAVIRLWTEGPTDERAAQLLSEWSALIERRVA